MVRDNIRWFFKSARNNIFLTFLIFLGMANFFLNSMLLINAYDAAFAYSILKPLWMLFISLGSLYLLFLLVAFLSWLGEQLKLNPDFPIKKIPKNIKTKEVKKRDGTRRRRSNR